MQMIARVVIPGFPHRVTQRGNVRQRIFFHSEDRTLSLAGQGEEDLTDLRTTTRTGRPVGAKPFVRPLEASLGRRLHALPGSRPRIPSGKAERHGLCPWFS
jgi:hypothetical protein